MDVGPVINVAVGICLKGHTPPKAYNDRMLMAFTMGAREAESKLAHEGPIFRFQWYHIGEIFVPYAREMLADITLKEGCDYLFMVDDDMLVPTDLFFQLYKDDKDIVAPLAFTRNPGYNPVCYHLDEQWDPAEKCVSVKNIPIYSYPRNKLFKCDATGFGAVLIKRRVLEGLKKPFFFSSNAIGEDILFCHKAIASGFEVWCDARIKLGHLGDSVVVTEDFRDQYYKMGEQDWLDKYGRYPTLEAVS